MGYGALVAAIRGRKHIRRVSTEKLSGRFQEDSLRRGKDALDREARVINSIYASDEIGSHQWTINPRQHVIVHHVDLTKSRPHLAHFRDKPGRKRREGDVALLDFDAFFAERHKEVTPSVRIDDGLKSDLRFMHLQGREWLQGGSGWSVGIANCADEVSDDADIRIERLR